ncbi:MAG: rod shape-determining protein MreD [Gammaproteobacteria bacterium]
MTLTRHHGGGAIVFTFIVALLLTIMPLPEWARYLRPDWVGLVLIYWCMAVPERVGVGSGWFAGLLVDLLTGAVLGQHALALAVVAFLTMKFHQRVRLFPILQQAFTVLVLLVLHQLIALWISRFIGRPGVPLHFWMPSLAGMLIWPAVYGILRGIRHGFRVN